MMAPVLVQPDDASAQAPVAPPVVGADVIPVPVAAPRPRLAATPRRANEWQNAEDNRDAIRPWKMNAWE